MTFVAAVVAVAVAFVAVAVVAVVAVVAAVVVAVLVLVVAVLVLPQPNSTRASFSNRDDPETDCPSEVIKNANLYLRR